MIARADVVINSETGAHRSLARSKLLCDLRTYPALAGELALAVGDDYL